MEAARDEAEHWAEMNGADYRMVRAREKMEGAGARVKRALPASALGYFDPFVLLDEFFVSEDAGFPEHDHGGFEIITYMIEGAFRHRDNMGNEAVIREGEIQWIRAGSGISHSEMPAAPGINHGLQLWINLPKSAKDAEPAYKQASAGQLPVRCTEGIKITSIAGPGSPIDTERPVAYQDIHMAPGVSYRYEPDDDWNTCVYVLSGRPEMPSVEPSTLIAADGALEITAGNEPVRFVLISGAKIGEPMEIFDGFVR